jgi:hypothetical protein
MERSRSRGGGILLDFDKYGFYKKLDLEISRLEKTAARLEGVEKEAVLQMVHALELECERFRISEQSRAWIDEEERTRSLSSIIEILNRIEIQVKELEQTVGPNGRFTIGSKEEADRIVEQFFYTCQVAEERIKQYGTRGYLTREQIADLNAQLKHLVHRLIHLSKGSDLLIDAVLHTYEARMFS